MTTARHRWTPRKRRRFPTIVAVVLALIGVLLIGLAACTARSGPPQPTASSAGVIDGDPVGASGASSSPPPAGTPGSPTAAATTRPVLSSPGATSPSTRTPTRSAPPKSTLGASTTPRPGKTVPVVAPTFPTTAKGLILQASAPVSLTIPSLGVSSTLLDLGLNADGTVQVPSLDDPHSKAGWYRNSPEPGSIGPAIILGHIDSKKFGPGVFYNLGNLKPGQEVDVTRKDGSVAVFRIDGVRSYPKNKFPTKEVYGNIDHAGLRLITCGGTFDADSGSYESNIVAFASLASARAA